MSEVLSLDGSDKIDKDIARLKARALEEIETNPNRPMQSLPAPELLKRALDFANKYGKFRPMLRSNPPATDATLKLQIARQKGDHDSFVVRKQTIAERFENIGVSPATSSSIAAALMRKYNIRETA